jgi:hypothetical protein
MSKHIFLCDVHGYSIGGGSFTIGSSVQHVVLVIYLSCTTTGEE